MKYMYKGKVIRHECDYVLFEIDNFVFKINVATNYIGGNHIFVHELMKDDELYTYGFDTEGQLNLFKKLVQVQGIGPKTGLGIISLGSIEEIFENIERLNGSYFKRVKGLSATKINNIFIKLKGTMIDIEQTKLIKALTKLGYTNSDIGKIKYKQLKSLDLESKIIEGIKMINE